MPHRNAPLTETGQLWTDLNNLNVNAGSARSDPVVAQLTTILVQFVHGDCSSVSPG